jgi:hypothetical protein
LQEQTHTFINIVMKEGSAPSSRKNYWDEMHRLLGFVANILPTPEGLSRAQHLGMLRLECMFHGPTISQYLCWLTHKRQIKEGSVHVVLYFLRRCTM